MDATRTRRTRDQARQAWYASHRQRRFARFLGFLGLGPSPIRAKTYGKESLCPSTWESCASEKGGVTRFGPSREWSLD